MEVVFGFYCLSIGKLCRFGLMVRLMGSKEFKSRHIKSD